MSTIQENLDIQNQILLMREQQTLREIFSDVLLGQIALKGLSGMEDIQAYSGDISFADSKITDDDLRGIGYLKSLVTFSNIRNDIMSIDISALKDLETINVYGNPSLENIGIVNAMTNLLYCYAYDNALVDGVGDVGACSSMVGFKLNGNGMSSDLVSRYLIQLKTAYQAGAPLSAGIDLTGNAAPSGGASNAEYLYLIGEGISVSIDS